MNRPQTLAEKLSDLSWGGAHSRTYEGQMNAAPTDAQKAAELNSYQRALVLGRSIEMIQRVFSTTIAGTIAAGNNVVNIPPRNVGLTKKFIIEISGTYNNTDGAQTATATAYGLANLLQQVSFVDLNNFTRIQTNGIHLALLKQMKHLNAVPGAYPIGSKISDAMVAGEFVASGSAPNFPVIVYPLPANGASSAFRAVFDVPLAYSDDDLRGAIYLNIVNAVANLQLTLNPNPSPAGADETFAVWGTAAGNISNVTIAVYQVYLDQLPVAQDGTPVLPFLDLSTVYELKNTNFSAISAGQDFPVSYANFRDFLSTLAIFNSTNATNGLKNGSDINYWALQSANLTNIFNIDPLLAAQRTREIFGSDLPLGTYYFSHRRKPISTVQFGNMQLVLNAASAAAGAYLNVMWEDFGMLNTLTQAGSLSAS